MNPYSLKQNFSLMFWTWGRAYQQNPDKNTVNLFKGAISLCFAGFVLAASHYKAPKELKFSLLLTSSVLSAAWIQYEKDSTTKQMRMVETMRQRTSTQAVVSHLQREQQAQEIRDHVQAGSEFEQVLKDSIPDPAKRQQYADLVGAQYGVPVAEPAPVSMGAMADPNPFTVEVESRPVFEMKTAPPSAQQRTRPKTEFERYLGDIYSGYTSRAGGDGTLPLHVAMEGRTRSGKSILAEVLLHSRLRDGIEKNYRVVPLVLSAHRRAKGNFKVQWCGLPELAKVPSGFQPGFVFVDPEDSPTALSEALTLLENEYNKRKHDGEEWSPKSGQTPLYMLIIDEIQDLVDGMGKLAAQDLQLRLGKILRGASKYGIAWWMLGHDFVETRSPVFNIALLKNCTHCVGFDELKTNARLSGQGAQEAMQSMTVNSQSGMPTGLYSSVVGYLAPAPLKSTQQLAFDWAVDEVELTKQKLSMINAVRSALSSANLDPKTIKDEMLLIFCEEMSNFSEAEIKEWIGSLRGFLAMPDADYQAYLDKLKELLHD
jgi:hypothetical protein